jgi:hypothetical protein
MRKAVNISNDVFQLYRRERRSLAIATSAFVLGFAFGVWLLPRESETWVKINSLRQKIIEKNETHRHRLPPNNALSDGLLTTSSPESEVSILLAYRHELKPT